MALEEVLKKYPRLRVLPTDSGRIELAGILNFAMDADGKAAIEDAYKIKISVPSTFPVGLPKAWETAGRIPMEHHRFPRDGSLCLGAPMRLSMIVTEEPSLLVFVEKCLVPYLYSYSYLQKYGEMPFGELAHGLEGIIDDLESQFGIKVADVPAFFHLGSLPRRVANKSPCPCGSGKRLGKCHNNKMNELRNHYGREWFINQLELLRQSFY